MAGREAPYVCASYKSESDETRIMVGIKGKEHRRMLSTLAHLLAKYGIGASRKYVEPFADGTRIVSLYFPKLQDALVDDLKRDLNVSLMMPATPETVLFYNGTFSPQTAMYASAAAAFTHQFLSILTDEYLTLQRALKDQPEARGIVDNLKATLIKDTYSTARISSTIAVNAKIVEQIYRHFELRCRGELDAARNEEQRIGS
jgi:hypothetical protein